MQALSFSFENIVVRTLGTPEQPLFVAVDVVKALGFKDTINPIKRHVDADDLVKSEITDSMNRQQTVNCVNESGLYALIFGSKLETAKRFKRWVTSEVLPAIRKTGRYECPAQPQYLTDQQCWAIQSAVGKRARGQGAHFQTIYRALKARFQVPTYTRILSKDFEAAISFIETCELRAPVRQETAPQLTKQDDLCPHCGLRPIPHDSIVLSASEAESLLTFIYYVRFLFRDANDLVYQLLRAVNSPMAGKFWDALHEVNWGRMLDTLARHGHDIRDMKCYQHFISDRA